MKTLEEIKGKTISELISSNILPSNENDIPMPGFKGRDEYEFVIKNSDAYGKWIERLTEVKLNGTEKQIFLATEIRDNKAKKAAFNIVSTLHCTKVSNLDLDFNLWSNNIWKEFKSSSASYYIENRF